MFRDYPHFFQSGRTTLYKWQNHKPMDIYTKYFIKELTDVIVLNSKFLLAYMKRNISKGQIGTDLNAPHGQHRLASLISNCHTFDCSWVPLAVHIVSLEVIVWTDSHQDLRPLPGSQLSPPTLSNYYIVHISTWFNIRVRTGIIVINCTIDLNFSFVYRAKLKGRAKQRGGLSYLLLEFRWFAVLRNSCTGFIC